MEGAGAGQWSPYTYRPYARKDVIREEVARLILSTRSKRAFLARQLHMVLLPIAGSGAGAKTTKKKVPDSYIRTLRKAYGDLLEEMIALVLYLQNQLGAREAARLQDVKERLLSVHRRPVPPERRIGTFAAECQHLIDLFDELNDVISRTPLANITMRDELPEDAWVGGLDT